MLDPSEHAGSDGLTHMADESAVQNYVGRIVRLAQRYEFASFTIGTALKLELADDEATLLKRDLNRRVALGVHKALPDREPVLENADVTFLLRYPGRWVEIFPKPIYVYGRYLKFVRDLPQAKWLCPRCRGQGCSACGGTGRIRPSSVEEVIASPLVEAFQAEGTKMHATGRQDVDVRMLGGGRPFAVELLRPRKRAAELGPLEQRINASQAVAARGLRIVPREIVTKVDTARAEKTYRALVTAASPVDADSLRALSRLAGGVIYQQTPQRVAHRRADRVRERKILNLSARLRGGGPSATFEIEVRAESGTYIKELVSGDGGRTRPSVSEILGTACTCEELDVLEVHFDPLPDL
jgi:tRNA pseudouridine synthase 10